MTHQNELCVYKYGPFGEISNARAVGWLSKGIQYSVGETDGDVIVVLSKIELTNLCRGYHRCEFCDHQVFDDHNHAVAIRALGNGEIWIKGENGIQYAMPAMVVHYIQYHRYKLPNEVEVAIRKRKTGLIRRLLLGG